jgi:[acyl-carrier-protein] S-malonyltransferase
VSFAAESIAVLFPGQGSIVAGAGRSWVDHPAWSVVDEVEAIADRPVAPLLLDAPAESLATTDAAQIATLTLSLVAWQALRPRLGDDGPLAFAGHSLGQVTALIAAGAVERSAGIALAVARADACRAADDAAPGRLAALLGASLDHAAEACAAADGACWVANDNAPGQVVIGGTPEGLEAAIDAARGLGVRKAMPLAVGGAFHTPLLQPAVDALAPVLAATAFVAPSAPIVDNTEATVRRSGDVWAELLARHLVEPVRWREVQGVLAGDLGATELVELAPAGTLTAMAKRTIPEVTPRSLDDLLQEVTVR